MINPDKTITIQGFHIIFYIAFLILYPLGGGHALAWWADSKDDFTGTWKGEGRVIVAWCGQKYVSFELQIDADRNVSGKIGDARIRHGTFRRNSRFYRWMGNKEYIIDAKLSDYLVENEKIKRDAIRIFLDFTPPFFTGGFHTSGSKFGGKEKMVFSGSHVKLVKAALPGGLPDGA